MVSIQIPHNLSVPLKRSLGVALVVFCVLLALAGCKGKSRRKTPQPGDKIYSVSVFKAPLEEISQSLETKGTFVPSDKLDVKSEVEGKIASVTVTEGQSVNVGDPLASIDPENLNLQLERLRAELREAEARSEGDLPIQNLPAMRNLRNMMRPRGLAGAPPTLGLTPETPPESPEEEPPPDLPLELPEEGEEETPQPSPLPGDLGLEKPEAVRRAEDASVERIRAEIALTEKKIESANLTAGISGTVSKKNVADGSVVALGEILFQIVRLDPIWISVFVPPETAAALKPDEKPDVMPDDLPDQTISGDIVFVSPEPDPQNKNYEIRVAIPNTQLKLKGGMNGKVLLPVTELRRVVTVPGDAVIVKDGKRYVYVAQGQTAERREVSLGKRLSGKFEIKRGVKEGDLVVIKGQQDLKEEQEFVKVESL